MLQRRFAIREVCDFLGVRPHVLRYWEREVPLLSPKKGISGHREYSWADLEILLRIRHLLHDRGYTLDGVRKRLWAETSAEYQDTKAYISALRAELLELSERSSKLRTRFDRIISARSPEN